MDKFFLSLKRFRFYSFWFCTNLRKKYRDIFSGKKNIFFLLEIICRRKLSAEVLGRRKKFFFPKRCLIFSLSVESQKLSLYLSLFI